MSEVEPQLRAHARLVGDQHTPLDGPSLRAAAGNGGVVADSDRDLEPEPDTDVGTPAVDRGVRRQRQLIGALAAVMAVVLALGVVIWSRHGSDVTDPRDDGSSTTDVTGGGFRPDPQPSEMLRVVPADGAAHVEMLSQDPDQQYTVMFVAADGRQYALGVGWNGGPPGFEPLLASMRAAGPTQDVTVGGSEAIQELCSEGGQRTINGVPVSQLPPTGQMTVSWLHDGWTLSLGLAVTGENTDCAPDGETARSVLSAAEDVQFISQAEWDELISTASPEPCSGYVPAFPGATLLRC